MGEVGDQGPAFHEEIGAYAKQRGIDHFWCAGDLCKHAAMAYGSASRYFEDTDELVAELARPLLDPMKPAPNPEPDFGSVLVKGSRFMKMERVVAQLGARDDKEADDAA